MSKITLAVDFDGVIHSYTSGWKGEDKIPDPPVHDAIPFLGRAVEEFDVVIYSTRAKNLAGRKAIRDWLEKHGLHEETLEQIKITSGKPPAILYIDDRAYRFEGAFPSMEMIKAFRPWNKRYDE